MILVKNRNLEILYTYQYKEIICLHIFSNTFLEKKKNYHHLLRWDLLLSWLHLITLLGLAFPFRNVLLQHADLEHIPFQHRPFVHLHFSGTVNLPAFQKLL